MDLWGSEVKCTCIVLNGVHAIRTPSYHHTIISSYHNFQGPFWPAFRHDFGQKNWPRTPINPRNWSNENVACAVHGRRPPSRPGSPPWDRTLMFNFLYVRNRNPSHDLSSGAHLRRAQWRSQYRDKSGLSILKIGGYPLNTYPGTPNPWYPFLWS